MASLINGKWENNIPSNMDVYIRLVCVDPPGGEYFEDERANGYKFIDEYFVPWKGSEIDHLTEIYDFDNAISSEVVEVIK